MWSLAVTGGFLLAGAQLNHAVVNSLLIFAALHTGHAPFGYVDWAQTAAFAALGNLVGAKDQINQEERYAYELPAAPHHL